MVAERRLQPIPRSAEAMASFHRGVAPQSLEVELMEAIGQDLADAQAPVGVGGSLAQTAQSPTGRRTPRTSVRGSAREGVPSAPTPSPVRIDPDGKTWTVEDDDQSQGDQSEEEEHDPDGTVSGQAEVDANPDTPVPRTSDVHFLEDSPDTPESHRVFAEEDDETYVRRTEF